MKKIIIVILFILTIVINIFLMFKWDGSISMSGDLKEVFNTNSVLNNTYKIKLLDNLNDDEILVFNDCIKNLSQLDIERIKEKLNSGRKEDIEAAFKLMKIRLSNSEYIRVKQVFTRQLVLNSIKI